MFYDAYAITLLSQSKNLSHQIPSLYPLQCPGQVIETHYHIFVIIFSLIVILLSKSELLWYKINITVIA